MIELFFSKYAKERYYTDINKTQNRIDVRPIWIYIAAKSLKNHCLVTGITGS